MLEALTAMNAQNVTADDDVIFNPPLKFVVVLPDATGGTVELENEKGGAVSVEIDATLTAPVLIPGRVRRVLASTTMDADYILGVR